jgi:tetratricopeptide (TPR) repeat protein
MKAWCYALIGVACLLVAQNAVADDEPSYKPPAAASNDSAGLTQARAAIAAKDYPGAIKILYMLSQSSPQNADVVNLLGFSYRMLGQYPQAFAYYDRALAIDPMHRGALEYEGEAYLETHQLPKAEANLATLRRACGSAGCPEIGQLAQAIDRYKMHAKLN